MRRAKGKLTLLCRFELAVGVPADESPSVLIVDQPRERPLHERSDCKGRRKLQICPGNPNVSVAGVTGISREETDLFPRFSDPRGTRE